VLAMREGAWLAVDGDHARLEGSNGGLLFSPDHVPRELALHEDLSWLLAAKSLD
jgi:hypothetical protein